MIRRVFNGFIDLVVWIGKDFEEFKEVEFFLLNFVLERKMILLFDEVVFWVFMVMGIVFEGVMYNMDWLVG